MIEEALRKRLQPIVNRRRRLHLARRLSAYWFVLGLAGTGLITANWYWGWSSLIAIGVLCLSAVLATLLALYGYHRMQPDYKAAAHNIEKAHPEARELLDAAIEQEPDDYGRLGYLQEWVIGEALTHAAGHDWLRSVSPMQLLLARCAQIASLVFLLFVVSQLAPFGTFAFKGKAHVPAARGYEITVSPGDTSVQSGTPVVILARFDGRVPAKVSLLFGPSGEEPLEIELTKNLNDPLFGTIIQNVNSDLIYYIKYAGKRTRDYEISIYEHPALVTADARIIYPAYTKLPEKFIKDTRRVSAAEGSQIILTFVLNKAVAEARLVPKEGETVELTADSELPNVYTTSMTARDDRRYELLLADAQGLRNKVPQRFAIDVHKNLPPEIKPLFPNRDVLASPLEELSLEAEISDDYGVTAYGLSYTLTGTQNNEIALGQLEASKEKQLAKHLLAMEDLDAQPDQLLTYSFWADDVGIDGNIRRTFGDMYFAEVRHFEEIFREGQSSQNQSSESQGQEGEQQQGDQLAQLQKQIIVATWNIKRQADGSDSIDDHKEDIDVVRQSQADVLEKAREVLGQTQDPPAVGALQAATKHMETSLDHLDKAGQTPSAEELTPALASERSAYEELLKLRQREHQVARSQSSGRRSSSAASARSERQLQQLELRENENRYEAERLARSEEQPTQREDLQVLNRLRELARRQNEMSDKLKELEAALRQAQNEQQKEEIRRELKRLREEQLEAIRDVDELQQRMERPENRRRMADSREQLDQSRSRIRESAEELEKGMVSRAITSATRAQRELEQMRDEFRRRTSGEFVDEMRDMRQQAQQLDTDQRQIADEIKEQLDLKQKILTDSGVSSELADRIDRQKTATEDLIDRMKNVSEQAETSEPLLSKKLYDTLRKASSENIDKALEVTGELLRRNFLQQAQEIERPAGKGIEEIRKGIEEAAGSVLGNEAESLRMAREQLDELIQQVNEEAASTGRAGQRQAGDANDSADSPADRQQRAEAQRGGRGGRAGDPNEPSDSSAERQQRAEAQRGAGGGRAGDPNGPANQQANQQRAAGARTATEGRQPGRRNEGGREDPSGWGGDINTDGPLTGEDFRQWSDGLRDVEEMVSDPDLRSEAARVRDRARSMREEFKRHGKEPQWDLVREQITNPLTELRDRISQELAGLESDEAMVPIDRDPVPGRFAELVRRYYENLGGEE
ncbi:MAG: DUF4175 family protein [Planctomycetota bacterium]